MRRSRIIGVGEYLPAKVLTNYDLERLVDTSDEWITSRTGIKERRLAKDDESTSELAAAAAREALKDARLDPKDLDLIIVATITPDLQFPATACFVQHKLKAKKAACFDISAACSGFVYALQIANQFIACGTYKNALVIGAEKLSSITDWQDRSTCVLFGDGAGACVLSEADSAGILSTYLACDGSNTGLLNVPAGGSSRPASPKTLEQGLHYIKMQGNELFKIAVRSMVEAAEKVLLQAGLKFSDIDLIIPHQANTRIIFAVAKKLGIPEEKIYLNIERCGNMSSASTATALVEAVKAGMVKPKDLILLDTFGAGLVSAACIIEW